MTKEHEIVWSVDQENFNYDSLGDALAILDGMDELAVGRIVWFGEAEKPNPVKYFDADDLLEEVGNRAYDDGGEHAEDYPDVSDEAKAELGQFLSDWLTKHCQPSFWRVNNPKEYTITEADIAEWRTP